MPRSPDARLRDPAFLLLLGTLTTLPLSRPALFGVGASSMQVTDVLLGLAYIAWAIQAVRRKATARPDALLAAGTAFVAVLALSALRSPEAAGASLLKLVAFAAYVLLPWLATQVIVGEDRLRWAVAAWLAGTLAAVTVALAGIVAFAFDRDVLASLGCVYGRLPELPFPRMCVPFRNPNLLANYLTASGPLVLACGGIVLRPRAHAMAVVAVAVVAASTLSSGIGGFALALAIAVAATTKPVSHWLRTTAVVVGALVALGFAVATVGYLVPEGRGQVPIDDEDFHFVRGPRVHTWLSAAGTVRSHPVLGTGYGTLVARTPGRDLSRWFDMALLDPFRDPASPRYADAHNVWLSVTGQSGFLGLAAFVVLLGVLARRMSIRPLPLGGGLADLPAAAVAGVVGALLFHGLFASAEEARHLWALFGLAAAAAALRGAAAGARPIRDRTSAS